MWMGFHKLKVLDFKTTKEYIKALEVYVSFNVLKKAFHDVKIKKMKTKLNLWLSWNLTIYGKSLLAKALGISQLVYSESVIKVACSRAPFCLSMEK